MAPRKTDESPVFQLKITLQESQPPIWRRLQIRGSTTLYKCHQIVQIVMGWTDSHLHQFIVDGVYYGISDPDRQNLDMKSERHVNLGQLVTAVKDQFTYEYDFGDNWQHAIVVEKILSAESDVRYPVCLAGKRACPPEDVGGIGGYAAFTGAIQHSQHPAHADLLAWVGGSFDPDAFDREAINQALRYL